jgi:hypothetical protein
MEAKICIRSALKTIELFYFDDCPSWKTTLQYINEILGEGGFDGEIRFQRIETNEEAARCQFPGSPTIKIDGQDLFPTNQTQYALGCRVYQTPQGFKGTPTKSMIAEKIAETFS